MAVLPQLYTKPWRAQADQIALLPQRGLVIADPAAATGFLHHLGYFRFCGYCLAFEQTRRNFIPGTTFEQIKAAYEFDRILRDLVTEALEVVELDLRTGIAYSFGQTYGPFGHTQPGNFFHGFKHQDWLDKLHKETQRSRELFVLHFKLTYQGFPDLPIWMAMELISFNMLSWMYQGMRHADQRAVASRYGLQQRTLASWLHHLVYLRNLCAHHSRLWDRVWAIKPDLPAGNAWLPPLVPSNGRLFATLLIQRTLLSHCPTQSVFAADWRRRVETLLNSPPAAPNAAVRMDLSPTWNTHPQWI